MKRRMLVCAPGLWPAARTGLTQVTQRPARIGVLQRALRNLAAPRHLCRRMCEFGWIDGTHDIVDTRVEDALPAKLALEQPTKFELVIRRPRGVRCDKPTIAAGTC